MVFSGTVFVFINDGAPSDARGTLNGLAQITVSLMRAFASLIAASLFAASLEKNIVGGNLVYIFLCVIASGNVYASFQLPNK